MSDVSGSFGIVSFDGYSAKVPVNWSVFSFLELIYSLCGGSDVKRRV